MLRLATDASAQFPLPPASVATTLMTQVLVDSAVGFGIGSGGP